MDLHQAELTSEMVAAHGNAHVLTVVDRFLAAPVDGMVKLLAQCMYSTGWDPRSFRSLILVAGIPTDMHDLAYEMLDAATSVAAEPNAERCRGAILEQVAHGLIALRLDAPELYQEQCIGELEGSWWTNGRTDSIDLVIIGTPNEVYDCKNNPFEIISRHVHQFRLVSELYPGTVVGFVTLAMASILADYLSEFTDAPLIHAFALENFLGMRDGPTTLAVAG